MCECVCMWCVCVVAHMHKLIVHATRDRLLGNVVRLNWLVVRLSPK